MYVEYLDFCENIVQFHLRMFVYRVLIQHSIDNFLISQRTNITVLEEILEFHRISVSVNKIFERI